MAKLNNTGFKIGLFKVLETDCKSIKVNKTITYTGYFNEIFKHEAGIIMNFRFVELDLGVSLQGSDFKSSFKGAGIGAFVNFAVGF